MLGPAQQDSAAYYSEQNDLMNIKRINLSEADLVIGLFDKYRVFYKKDSDNYTAQSLYEAIGFQKQEPDTEYLLYRIPV
jgi:hypothetical protein